MTTEKTNAPSAKRLVLSLLSAPSLPEVSSALLVRWGQLFEIDAASMRVTVGRLARQGLLSSTARGVYRMGPAAQSLAATASGWRHAEARVRDWHGDWLLVHVAHLGRVNRTALRARERAFRLGGFAEYVSGLWCRPANLDESADQTRARLLDWGLESAALVVQASALPGVQEQDLFSLWPRRQLEKSYRAQCRNMQASRKRLPRLSLDEAARETLLVGEAVIRQINADPLLPQAMIDTRLRRAMVDGMLEYDELGRSVWARFVEQCAP